MRAGIVVVGVVLLVIGAALLFVPLSPQPAQTLTQSSETTPAGFTIAGFSITGNIPITVTWSSNTTVLIVAVACSGTCANENLSTLSGVTQTGTSGTFSLNVPTGGQVWIAAGSLAGAPSSTTVNVKTALTTVGSLLLILGVLLLLVGLVLKSKSKAMRAPPPEPAASDAAPMTNQ
ncbi:MAG: hypothetical protein L3K17_02805 [Thermoplasmata archaeon]|nr:hypothetical protein [Thermoplasmata archaeon]